MFTYQTYPTFPLHLIIFLRLLFPVYNYVFFPSGPFQAFYCLINCSKNLHLSSFVLLSPNSLSRCLLLFSLSLFCLLLKKSTSSPGIFFCLLNFPLSRIEYFFGSEYLHRNDPLQDFTIMHSVNREDDFIAFGISSRCIFFLSHFH